MLIGIGVSRWEVSFIPKGGRRVFCSILNCSETTCRCADQVYRCPHTLTGHELRKLTLSMLHLFTSDCTAHGSKAIHPQLPAEWSGFRPNHSANYTMTIERVNFFSRACIDPPDLLFLHPGPTCTCWSSPYTK